MGQPIAIIIPFYNGLETIRQLVQGCVEAFSDPNSNFRIIVVDDSADQSKHVGLQTELSGIKEVEILKLSRNFGQHVATFIGLLTTSNEDVITMDEDLQFHPSDISKLIAKGRTTNSEVIYGHVNRKGVRGVFRDSAIGAIKPLLANNYPKFTSSFRFLDKTLVEVLKKQRPGFIQIEGLVMHHANDFGYVQVTSTDQRKETGSGYSLLSLFWMLTALVNHYSMLPLSLVSLLLVGCNVALLVFKDPIGFSLLPFSVFAVLTLIGEFKTRRVRSAISVEMDKFKEM